MQGFLLGFSSRAAAVRRVQVIEPQTFCRRAQGTSATIPHHEEKHPQQHRSQPSHRPSKRPRRNSQAHPHNDHKAPNIPHPPFDIEETDSIARFLPGPLATIEDRRAQKKGKYKRDPRGWIHFIPERPSRNITDSTAMSQALHPPPPSPYGVRVQMSHRLQKGVYFPLPYGQRLASIPPPATTPFLTGELKTFRRKEALMPMAKPWPLTVNSGLSAEERLAFLREEEGDKRGQKDVVFVGYDTGLGC